MQCHLRSVKRGRRGLAEDDPRILAFDPDFGLCWAWRQLLSHGCFDEQLPASCPSQSSSYQIP